MSEIKDKATIYKIEHTATGRCYVGHTTNVLRVRYSQHRQKLNKGNHHAPRLQALWTQYGSSAFELIIIEACDFDARYDREQWHINNTENLNGIQDVRRSRLGTKQPAHEVARVRAMMMGNQYTKGRKVPEEEKLRRAAFHKGRKRPPETGQRISAALKGNQNALGRIVSEETREKIRIATRGPRPHVKKVHSAEALAKISLSNKVSKLYRYHLREGTEPMRDILKHKMQTASLEELQMMITIVEKYWSEGTAALCRLV